MFILPKDEFMEELKAEMAGYEEITEELREDWIKRFDKYLTQKTLKDKRISVKGSNILIKLEDESELFGIVDKYYAAIENEDLEKYWIDWSL